MNTDKTLNDKIYERNELLWGKEAQQRFFEKHVMVFGLGGVGAYTTEALARSGIGQFTLIDFDVIAESNINRQLLATIPDIGKLKTDLMKERIHNINPNIKVNTIADFYSESLNETLFNQKIDYVIDAIDSQKSKVELLASCYKLKIPVITSLGAGNRIYPEKLFLADIKDLKTRKCQFARRVLHKLKQKGVTEGITAIFSEEKPFNIEKKSSTQVLTTNNGEEIEFTKFTPGSSPFVPPVAGYMMAGYVVRSFL